MIVNRTIAPFISDALREYPVVVITGPRQTGKTTLAKMLTNKPYYNLESPDVRSLAITDPRLFLRDAAERGAIIDEFQRVPELASYIQSIVDDKKVNGQFILTGSNNFLMMENVSQTLAGRAALFKLLPFGLEELQLFGCDDDTNDLIYKGFYPSIYSENRQPTRMYDSYYQTYIERDVHQLINIKDLHLFQRFMRLCAGRTGQIISFENLSTETGVSTKTVKQWLSVLESSYIIYLLQPYFENFNKRIVKSPKLYFTDIGLASYLLGIEEKSHLLGHPLRGALFENMVINEFVKYRLNQGKQGNLYFFRDNHQHELDLILKVGNQFYGIEIKSAQTFHPEFNRNLNWSANIFSAPFKKVLIYDGEEEWQDNDTAIINFRSFRKVFSNA